LDKGKQSINKIQSLKSITIIQEKQLSQNESKTSKQNINSILIRMMMLEALLDIQLALLNLSADRVNLPLNGADISLHHAHSSQ
jgi:hypothetical protein